MQTLPIEHQKIESVVENYRQILRDIEVGLHHIQEARQRLKGTTGGAYDDIHKGSRGYFDVPSLENCRMHVTKNMWRYVLSLLNVRPFMTERRKSELEEQIESGKMPPLTVENAYSTLAGLMDNLEGLLLESVKEVFDWLRPSQGRYAEYKTNQKFTVGERVVLTWMIDSSWNFRVRYGRAETQLQALDNVFHLMDGQGTSKYPGDLSTAINTAGREKKQECETEYFRCKWYQNGNLHLQFKRLDLLKRLNQLGGGLHPGDLPGKEYKEQKAEEKARSRADAALAVMGL